MKAELILKALWNVRNGSPFEYQEGINFGICIGMASMLSYDEQVRLNALTQNAAAHARLDRAATRQAQKVAA